MDAFEDILYAEDRGVATITINRPEVFNAFRAQTVEELIRAFSQAGYDKSIGVVVLTGVGDKAFCTGGDQSGTSHAGGGYGGRGVIGLPIEELQSIIRDIPKPVIARVNGYAIGGGNVLVTLCDLAIASERAQLGQVGPKVGSVDPGFGTAFLSRVVGEKKAREIWYLCRRYTAAEALEMGLVNRVVPHDDLDAEVRRWCDDILGMSPTAIAIAKRSFNADSESIRGISAFAMQALQLYYDTEESKEGGRAFREKRKPDFHRYVGK
jgi:2-ketocyclohexanecarboxyl-CoA hydrolase